MYKQQKSIDPISLFDDMKSKGLNPSMRAIAAITTLSQGRHNDNKELKTYTDIIIKGHNESQLKKFCRQTLESIDDGTDIQVLLKRFKKSYDMMVGNGPGLNHIPVSELMSQTIETAKMMAKGVDVSTLQKTNIKSIDKVVKGLAGGEVFVLAARPGVGKTELTCKIVYETSVVRKDPVLVVNLEMQPIKLLQRTLKYEYDFSDSDLRSGRIDEGLIAKLELDSMFNNSPVYILNANGINVEDLSELMRKYVTKYGVKLVIIDYLQLLGTKERLTGEERINTLSRGVKGASMENNVPTLLLAQLNRSTDARPKKKPQIEDLKGSSGIEADADIVGLLWSQGKVNMPNLTEIENKEFWIIIAKFRDGATKDILLNWTDEGKLTDPHTELETDGTESIEDDELPF
jgi:replicative DNA helicase